MKRVNIMNCFERPQRRIEIYIILFVASMLCTNMFGQSESQLRKYYEENILSLDPIEGIYDVELITIPRNSFRIYDADVLKDNYQVYIYKEGNKFIRYNPINGKKSEYRKIGENNAYTYTRVLRNQKISDRIYLQNGSLIELEFNHPTSDKEYARIFLKRGNYVVYKETDIKTYPTSAMYTQKRSEGENSTIWTGTGFALLNGYVVTNYHVIANAKSINVKTNSISNKNSYQAKLIAMDKSNDLAILQISDKYFVGYNQIPYKVKLNTSDVGENVFVLGYPLTSTMGNEIKLTTGVISSKTGYMGNVALYQISAPVQPGNSGGPLFDDNGNLIGIICAKHEGAENVGYAIKTSYLGNLIEVCSDISIIPSHNTISTLSLANKVKKIEQYVFLIECSKE